MDSEEMFHLEETSLRKCFTSTPFWCLTACCTAPKAKNFPSGKWRPGKGSGSVNHPSMARGGHGRAGSSMTSVSAQALCTECWRRVGRDSNVCRPNCSSRTTERDVIVGQTITGSAWTSMSWIDAGRNSFKKSIGRSAIIPVSVLVPVTYRSYPSIALNFNSFFFYSNKTVGMQLRVDLLSLKQPNRDYSIDSS